MLVPFSTHTAYPPVAPTPQFFFITYKLDKLASEPKGTQNSRKLTKNSPKIENFTE